MPRPAALAVAIALVLSLAAAGPARADVQSSGPEVWPGKSALTLQLGFQNPVSWYGKQGGSPGGFRLLVDYDFRFYDAGSFTLWLDIGAALTLGGPCGGREREFTGVWGCGPYGNGHEVEPMAGVRMNFKVRPIPLVPYVRLDAFFSYIFNRYCGDNGFAFGGRAAGGAKYYLTRNLGVGLETAFTLGPGIYPYGAPDTNTVCFVNGLTYDAHTEIYATFELTAAAQYVFTGL